MEDRMEDREEACREDSEGLLPRQALQDNGMGMGSLEGLRALFLCPCPSMPTGTGHGMGPARGRPSQGDLSGVNGPIGGW